MASSAGMRVAPDVQGWTNAANDSAMEAAWAILAPPRGITRPWRAERYRRATAWDER